MSEEICSEETMIKLLNEKQNDKTFGYDVDYFLKMIKIHSNGKHYLRVLKVQFMKEDFI